MKNVSRLALVGAVAALGALSLALPGPAEAKNLLVDRVSLVEGQRARLDVRLSDAGPHSCRVTLAFVNAQGRRVRTSDPVSLSPGEMTSLKIAREGRFRAVMRVHGERCQRALQSRVEVF
jgi:hypothetical protein